MGFLGRKREPFPEEASPYQEDPPRFITTRDGKRLPVEHTLAMAQDVIDGPSRGIERGLALALEAALKELK